jgi:hypothetical protein
MQQGTDSFRLVVRRGPSPNQTYDLNKDIITIGRDITNDITINDPEVSRHHLRFTRGMGGFTIEDLGSTNGTFVNGQRLTGAKPLQNGDMIGLGETVTLNYEMVRGAVSARPDLMATAASPVPRDPGQPAPAVPGVQQPYSPYAQPQGQPQGYSPAPPPAAPVGYEYDPYAVREEEPRSNTRWIIIGCAALSFFCCCSTIAGVLVIDTLNLWCRIPVLYPILNTLGFYAANCQ